MPPILRTLTAFLAFLTAATCRVTGADNLGDNTTGKYPPAYYAIIREAMEAFMARDFEAAIKLVDRADLAFQSTPLALNIRGAIAIEQKKYDQGREFCLKALKDDPNFYPARFNLCEIQFVQGKYAEARALFQNLHEMYPSDDLVRFRIFLTFLLEKNESVARQQLEGIPPIGTSPVYYYCQAAWEFAHNNPVEAKKWLNSGNRIFPSTKHLNYVDVFYDLGWMKRPDPTAIEE